MFNVQRSKSVRRMSIITYDTKITKVFNVQCSKSVRKMSIITYNNIYVILILKINKLTVNVIGRIRNSTQ